MPSRFTGKTVIVTGAGSGIGRSTALAFAAEGATVVATDINPENLEALASEIGGNVRIQPGDISCQATIDLVLEAARGSVDVLVNNAGIMDAFLPVGEVDDTTWERVMSVNLTAVMRFTRAVLPLMLNAGEGVIVNVSSEAGLRGSCAGAAYTASKHAIVGLTKNTAFFYGPQGIRVNAIAPGAVKTGIVAPMESKLAIERVGSLFPVILPPATTAESIADNILWLSSSEAKNVNGVILPSDGGWSAV